MSTEDQSVPLAKLTDDSQEFWLRETVSLLALSKMPGIGYWTLRCLVQAGYSFSEILKQPSSFEEFSSYFSKASCRLPKKVSDSWIEVQKKLWAQGNELYRRLVKEDIKVIHSRQSDFPNSLRQVLDPPYWLFVQGNLSILHEPSITVVGTRNPSEDGLFLANYIGACIPLFGAVTVSGLATGIDQIIHKKSIRFQIPTVAILGNGIFKNYPTGSEALRYEICVNGGAILTEYLPEQNYSAENFVRRNRLQAGLGNILIPVEWRSQSGTAHTVRYAYESKKKILCIRMSDWKEKEHPELVHAQERGAKVLTIPQESQRLVDFVRENTVKDTRSKLTYKAREVEQEMQLASSTQELKVEQEMLGNEQEYLRDRASTNQLNLFD